LLEIAQRYTSTLETYRKHLIGLIKNKHLHRIGLQESSLDHVVDTARSTDNDLGAFLQGLHVITDASTTNASMALDIHEIANGDNDLLDLLGQFTGRSQDQSLALLDIWVQLLKDGNGESGGLSGSRLCLSNDIVSLGDLSTIATMQKPLWKSLTLDDWHDGPLLDSRRAFETISIDTYIGC
jgi:hypothetical protein